MKKFTVFIGLLLITATGYASSNEYIIHRTYHMPKGLIVTGLMTGDMKYVLAIDKRHVIRSWRYHNGRSLKAITTGDHKALAAVIHPAKSILYTGGKDKNINVWDIKKGTLVKVLSEHTGRVKALAISDNGELLLSGGADGAIRLWKLDHYKILNRIKEKSRDVVSLAFHPSNKIIAWANRNGDVKIWDLEKNSILSQHRNHTKPISRIKFSPNGKILASASADQKVILWDWAKSNIISTLSGHTQAVTGVSFHSSGKMILTCSLDGSIRLWNAKSYQELSSLNLVEKPVNDCSFSIDGKRILGVFKKNYVRAWTFGDTGFLADLEGHKNSIQSLDISPNGKTLVSVSLDNTIKVWDVLRKKKQAIKSFDTKGTKVNFVRFAGDNKKFATAANNEIRIRDRTKKDGDVGLFVTLKGHRGKINTLDFHPSRNQLISGGADKYVYLWDIGRRRTIYKAVAHTGQINAIQFSPDAQLYATASVDKTVKVWNLKNHRLLFTLKKHRAGVRRLAFSPDGKILASAGDDRRIILWNLNDGSIKKVLAGHDFIITDIFFSKNGKTLISASRDKTIRLWDMKKGAFIKTVSGEKEQITSLAINDRAKVIAIGTLSPLISLLKLPSKYFGSPPKRPTPGEGQTSTSDQNTNAFSLDSQADSSATDRGSIITDQDIAVEELGEIKDRIFEPVIEQVDHELLALQTKLNRLLKQRNTCENSDEVEATSYAILKKIPRDRAAYYGLMKVAVVNQDLSFVYLMGKLGNKSEFDGEKYDFLPSEDVDDFFDLWLNTVFSQVSADGESQSKLEFTDCENRIQVLQMPEDLIFIDIPREAIEKLMEENIAVDFNAFADLTNTPTIFRNRVFALVDAIENLKKGQKRLRLSDIGKYLSKNMQYGYIILDLSAAQHWGGKDNRPDYQLKRETSKRENGAQQSVSGWRTYYTDSNKKKKLILTSGNYYLRFKNKVRRAFLVEPGKKSKTIVLQ